MTYEQLNTISIVCFIVAGAFLLLSIVLFFVLDIRYVFGILTGVTVKKEVNSIGKRIETTGNEAEKKLSGMSQKLQRGRMSANLKKQAPVPVPENNTEKLDGNFGETSVLSGFSETTILSEGGRHDSATALDLEVSLTSELPVFKPAASRLFNIVDEVYYTSSATYIE